MAAKRSRPADKEDAPGLPAFVKSLPVVLLAWLIPGAGHFYLRRRLHGTILLLAISSMFLMGLGMQGRMFVPTGGDLFTTIMTYGGYFGDLCNGMLYFVTVLMGYEQEAMAGATHDYGTKFLVCSGLLNLLAIVDVHEIATGKKAEA